MKVVSTQMSGDNGKVRYFVTVEIHEGEYDYYSRMIGNLVRYMSIDEYPTESEPS